MAAVTMRQLLEAGIHFGHQTRRWNPKMGRYIFGERNGIYIIDLQKTLQQVNKAHAFVRDTVAAGGLVLFVGTKKQAQEPIAREAERCGMYFVNNRWLGGTLTNWATVRQSIRSLLRLEEMESNGEMEKLSKKEAASLRRDLAKLHKNLKGIKTMDRQPDVMFVIDAKKEAIAIREAQRLGITCIGVVDTNGDPDAVPIPVPGNDDAIRAVNLFCKIIADAVIEGTTQGEKMRAEETRRRIQESAKTVRAAAVTMPDDEDDDELEAAEAPAAAVSGAADSNQ